ncbi:MAG: extracellular solute-binding protein [Vallitaleaceae bacterium]|nr:extracellular solute-binding protein [Vallitaleaceae bacterium]
MKKMFSNLLAILLIGTMLFGCAPKVNDVTETTTSDSKEVTTESTTETAATSEQTVIKFVSWMTNGEDIPVVEAFMSENPDIKVEYEAIDGVSYDKLLSVRLMTDDAPDVYLIQWPQYAKYAQQDYLMDVTDQPSMSLLQTSPGLVNAYTIDGKQYGFPINTNGGPLPIYYNKVYFDKLGLTPPTTLEEFYTLCDKIKADGVDPLVFGAQDKWPLEFFFRFRQYTGTLDVHQQWAKELYEGKMLPSEFFKPEFEMAENLNSKGYISKASLTLSWPQSVPFFIEGKAAMFPQGPWVPGMPEFADLDPAKFQLACFTSPVVPAADGKIYATGDVDRSIVVSAQTKNKEAALRFFNWFNDEKNLAKYLGSQSLTTVLDLDYDINPVLADHIKNLSSDKYQMIMSQDVQMAGGFITDAMFNGFQNLLAGSNAADELKRLDSEFDKTKEAIIVLK